MATVQEHMGKTLEKRPALPFDFRQRTVLSRTQVAALAALHEKIAQGLSQELVKLAKVPIRGQLEEIEMMPARQLGRTRESCVLELSIEPGGFRGALVCDQSGALALIDRLMGGKGEPVEPEKPLTALELLVLKNALAWGALGALSAGWPRERKLIITAGEMKKDCSSAHVAPDWEIVGRVQFRFDGLSCPLRLAAWLSLGLLEQLATVEKPSTSPKPVEKKVDPKRSEKLIQAMTDVTVEARVELGGTDLSVAEVLNLHEGDVVRLDSKVSDGLRILVQGEPEFLGRPGLRNGQLAVQISGVIEKGQMGNGK